MGKWCFSFSFLLFLFYFLFSTLRTALGRNANCIFFAFPFFLLQRDATSVNEKINNWTGSCILFHFHTEGSLSLSLLCFSLIEHNLNHFSLFLFFFLFSFFFHFFFFTFFTLHFWVFEGLSCIFYIFPIIGILHQQQPMAANRLQ